MAATKAKVANAEEFREILDRALREIDDDERSGPLLRAAGLSLRIELTDIDLVLRLAATGEGDTPALVVR